MASVLADEDERAVNGVELDHSVQDSFMKKLMIFRWSRFVHCCEYLLLAHRHEGVGEVGEVRDVVPAHSAELAPDDVLDDHRSFSASAAKEAVEVVGHRVIVPDRRNVVRIIPVILSFLGSLSDSSSSSLIAVQ